MVVSNKFLSAYLLYLGHLKVGKNQERYLKVLMQGRAASRGGSLKEQRCSVIQSPRTSLSYLDAVAWTHQVVMQVCRHHVQRALASLTEIVPRRCTRHLAHYYSAERNVDAAHFIFR